MRAARSRRGWRGRRGRLADAGCASLLVLATVTATVAACTGPPTRPAARAATGSATGTSDTGPGTTSTPTPPGGDGAATARLDLESASPTPSSACQDSIGASLRERTTVSPTNLVTLVSGTLPCSGIGLWTATFTLDGDPTVDPAPRFGARYTGAAQLAVRLPTPTGRCSAAAVFFSGDADTGTKAAAAAAAAAKVRSDLATWPADSRSVVPGGVILQGRPSTVLAATVTGDPSACSPGESVSSPIAAPGDCWSAVPATSGAAAAGPPASTGSAASSTRFRRTACAEQHSHEVYWAEALTTSDYLAEGSPARLGAAAWARTRAEKVCAGRSRAIILATGVDRNAVFLELLWPATLAYPPPTATGWSKAQLVCLIRWKDGTASTRRILRG